MQHSQGPKTICGVCNKTIAINHKSIECTNCNNKVHIKCNKIDVKSFEKIMDYSEDFLYFV